MKFQTITSRTGWFILLVLLQALVFNHVHIFGYATPMPYVFFLLILPSDTPRWASVALAFALGLCVDLFTNTPGLAASSLCLIGLIAPLLRNVFAPKDSSDSYVPSHKTMEWSGFTKYAFFNVLVYCLVFFSLEAFSFFDWQVLLINIAGSTLLTTLFVIAMELIRNK